MQWISDHVVEVAGYYQIQGVGRERWIKKKVIVTGETFKPLNRIFKTSMMP